MIAAYARKLAETHAARQLKSQVASRYATARAEAERVAKAEVANDLRTAMQEAKGKDAKTTARLKKEAEAAGRAKVAAAVDAVKPPDPATLQKDLSDYWEDRAVKDFNEAIRAAIARFGPSWRVSAKKALAKQKNAFDAGIEKAYRAQVAAMPKPKKGEPRPLPRARLAPAEIAAQLNAEALKWRAEQDAVARGKILDCISGWMVERREELDFEFAPQTARSLGDFNFAPDSNEFRQGAFVPATPDAAGTTAPIPDNIIDSIEDRPTTPELRREVTEVLVALKSLEPTLAAGNYHDHGGGKWENAGCSADRYIRGAEGDLHGADGRLANRGFWRHDAAVRFLLHLNEAVTAAGGQWRALYNDYQVAEEVNQTTGWKNVISMANMPKKKFRAPATPKLAAAKTPEEAAARAEADEKAKADALAKWEASAGGLNWHGPSPMVLHFHLDFFIPPKKPPPANEKPAAAGAAAGG